MKNYLLLTILASLAAFWIGCGGSENNNTNPEAPTIESVTPVDLSEDIASDTNIWIVFSREMDRASVEAAFVLQGDSDAVVGTFVWDEINMVFSPTTALAQGETYSIVVGTGAMSADGKQLAQEFSSSFSTAFTVGIVEVVPEDGAAGVAADALIEVTFRGAMNPTTVEDAFSLTLAQTELTGVFTWQEENKVMTFDPDLDFEVASEYTLTIATGASDADGNFLLSEFISTFTTTAPAPTVSGPVVDALPTWTWTAKGDVTAYRYQLDAEEDGAWTELEATVTEYTPLAALSDGEHTLYVQAAYGQDNWTQSGSWTVLVGTVYEGDLTVASAADISGFNYLKITGNLHIEGSTTLVSLAGLESLLVVGGNVRIQYNSVLASLTGLDNLTVIHGALSFSGNTALANLYGLEGLEQVGGLSFMMANISSMEGLSNLTLIDGNLFINQSSNLNSYTGLQRLATITGNVEISRAMMIDCTGLSNIETIGGDLKLFRCSLESLTGFDGLQSIGGSLLFEEGSLGSVQGLEKLQEIGGDLKFADMSGMTDLVGLSALTEIGGGLLLSMTGGPTSLAGLEGLVSIGDQFLVSYSSITSTCNFAALESIGGQVNFGDNNALSTMGSYPLLTSIGGNLSIIHNGLTGLGDFSALTTLGGNLSVAGNFSMPNCQAENLAAQLVAAGWEGTSNISDNGAGTCD
ncbi:MAG: Ig-like domain-containing protein [Deltaproteobacteria bacterium]|nr:Ig-like domain-containing protein [Deltaproteobacteria bacterium]